MLEAAIFDKSDFESLMENIRIAQDDVNQSAVLICREGKCSLFARKAHYEPPVYLTFGDFRVMLPVYRAKGCAREVRHTDKANGRPIDASSGPSRR